MQPPKMPAADAIQQLFSATLSRDVRVRLGDLKTNDWQSVVATYRRRDDGGLGAAWISSIEVAASLGAGLSMIPVAVVRDCIKQHELEAPVLEGFGEVANIATQLLSGASQAPLALGDIRVLKRDQRGKLDAALLKPTARLDFEAEVAGYVKGSARFVLL